MDFEAHIVLGAGDLDALQEVPDWLGRQIN